jgi:hypothetical protein
MVGCGLGLGVGHVAASDAVRVEDAVDPHVYATRAWESANDMTTARVAIPATVRLTRATAGSQTWR